MAGQMEKIGRAGENPSPAPSEDASPAPSKERQFWRTGLLLTSSAALGGIAVAIWNRRSLARIRQKYESVPPANQEDDVLR
jgi:hypothetical protein